MPNVAAVREAGFVWRVNFKISSWNASAEYKRISSCPRKVLTVTLAPVPSRMSLFPFRSSMKVSIVYLLDAVEVTADKSIVA